MLDAAVIALALESRTPWTHGRRADYIAGAIARVAGSDDEAAVLLTNGLRESGWSTPVERCAIEGLGGWGAFGVAGFWARRFPGGTCGPIDAQARASRAVWLAGTRWGGGLRIAFGHYVGAKRFWDNREAKVRVGLYYSYRGMIACRCSTSFFITGD